MQVYDSVEASQETIEAVCAEAGVPFGYAP